MALHIILGVRLSEKITDFWNDLTGKWTHIGLLTPYADMDLGRHWRR